MNEKLNVRTSKASAQHVGLKLFADTISEIDECASEMGVLRSAMIRHIINEYLDGKK